MRQPWEWQEDDILALVLDQRKEHLGLEYKRSDALAKSEPNKREISKDVSAMANSAGGTIIYGVDEQKKSDGPIQLDHGVDAAEFSSEWLEQVIDSNIQRRIPNVRVHAIKISRTGKFVYVVSVPQSTIAPHMAADHRYYKRLGTTTAFMEEYEVRDVGRRLESPDLHLDLDVRFFKRSESRRVHVDPRISNHSAEPVLYATIYLYVQQSLSPVQNSDWSRVDSTEMLWNNRDRDLFHALRYLWSVSQRPAILEGDHFQLMPVEVCLPHPTGTNEMFNIGWEIKAPKASPKIRGLKLRVDGDIASIVPATYSFAVA